MNRQVPWLLVMLAGHALAQPAFDARDLTPVRNLISNPSFEAPTEALPPGYSPVVSGASFTVSRAQAFHAQASLLITGTGVLAPAETTVPTPGVGAATVTPGQPGLKPPPTAPGPATPGISPAPPPAPPPAPVLRQDIPACGGCTYELSGWIRHVATGPGEAWLGLEMLDRDDRSVGRQQVSARGDEPGWRQVSVQLKAPKEATVVRVLIGADAGVSAHVDALRLRIVAGKAPKTYRSPITDIHTPRIETTWATIKWEGPNQPYEISYRQRRWPRDQRIVSQDVPGFAYSLVGLEPETTYQVSVRLVRPPHYDEQGRIVEPPVRVADPKPLSVTTAPWQYREVGLLRLWPTRVLQLMDGPGANPRLDAAKGFLYLAQEYGGGIHLSKMSPDKRDPEWTRQLVAPVAGDSPPVLRDIHVLADTLYTLYQRGPTELNLIPFNLELEQQTEPVVVPLGEPANRISHAALAGYRNQLWLLWLDEMGKGEQARGIIRLALFVEGRLTDTYAWGRAPVPVPAEPSLAVFGDELVIPFTDALAEALEPGYQPLQMIGFNGLTFELARKLRDFGRNRQPRGTQLGPNLYLVFGSDAAYLSYQGRYRDLMLATLPPGQMSLETVTYVDDQKYNVSPDIVALGDSLWTVHDKYDYAPAAETPTPYHFGVFLGRIDFGPVRE